MTNKTYNIGISCIGSGVGQSIINSLRLSRLPIRTIGFGNNPFAYGAYDCDAYDYTQNIYQEGFIDNLIEKCIEHKIELVIPGLDDEALLYSQNISKFSNAGIKALCAGSELISLCRDKERMGNELNKTANIFVQSYCKENLKTEILSGKVEFPLIAKPRRGFASREIIIIRSMSDLDKVGDDHIIQEIAIPDITDHNYDYFISEINKRRNPQVAEISIQLVYSDEGQFLGHMASYNKLNHGVPIEIIPYDNAYIWMEIEKIVPVLEKLGLRGPLNIQGRLTKNGLKLFEMNARFTGITGLRALMGFNEVEACVKEWLDIDKGQNTLALNYNQFGVRQTADKAIPLDRNTEITHLFNSINGGTLKKKKTVLITGSCGYLGQSIINSLSQDQDYELWAFDLNKERTIALFGEVAKKIYDNQDIEWGRLPFGYIDILLHLGFTRAHGTNNEIAKSLNFTGDLFSLATMHQVPAIINISSQSVYGLETPPLWTENTELYPSTPYAEAKYATELLLNSLTGLNKTSKASSLRLCALAGGAPGLIKNDFLSRFVLQAIRGEPIRITGGNQVMERLDIRDAVNAINKMIKSDPLIWKPVYNLGSGKTYRLMDIANKVVEISTRLYSRWTSKIIIDDKKVDMKFGMDNSLFCSDFHWKPEYSIEETIVSLFQYLTRN